MKTKFQQLPISPKKIFKLLAMAIIILNSLSNLIALAATDAQGAETMTNIMPYVPNANAAHPAVPTNQQFTEYHWVMTLENVAPNLYCQNRGAYVENSRQQLGNILGSLFLWSYYCLVSYSKYQIAHVVNNEVTGWITPSNTTDVNGLADSENITLQYSNMNGLPNTTYWTDDWFDWGYGTGELYSASLQFDLGTSSSSYVPASAGNSGSGDSVVSASITMQVYPYEELYMSKQVSHNGGWTDYCNGYYSVQFADIGNTVHLDCCLGYAPNGQDGTYNYQWAGVSNSTMFTCCGADRGGNCYCGGNQQWGSEGFPSFIYSGGGCPW